MVVGAGQSALTDVPLLHKLMDRFTIRVPLSDAEVEKVTRKVLLQKKPASVVDVEAARCQCRRNFTAAPGHPDRRGRRRSRRHRRGLSAAAGAPAVLGALLPADRRGGHP